MKQSLFIACLSIFLFRMAPADAQTIISGVINTYTPVTEFGCDSTRLVVDAVDGFSAGDKVLLIQMKGAAVSLANNITFGDITDVGNAGNYEFNRVESINGSNEIKLQYKLLRNYDVTGKVQLVRVPEYDNVIAANLGCKAWDGTTGGVLALDIAGTLTLDGDIDVSGLGFRGGQVVDTDDPLSHETEFFYPVDPASAAEKGEGIAEIPADQSYGRGKSANGGGGGNAHNGGGGGGGNAGLGGNGGLEYYNTPGAPTPGTNGIGGSEIFNLSIQRVLMGGGGGAGHTNDNVGTSGGNGGGIVLLKAGTIESNGHSILANGADVFSPGTNRNDGQGGGGAGGSIMLIASQVNGTLPIETKGGRGGDCLFFVQSQIIGPGGGGGGGKLALSQLFPTVTVNLNGGENGIANQNLTNDAQPGTVGSILFPFAAFPEGTVPDTTPTLDLGPDVILCVDSTVVFDAGPGFASYLWQDGSTDQTYAATDLGFYWVEVTDACGFKQFDTVLLTVNLLPDTKFPDTTLCMGNSVIYPLPGFDFYAWAPATGLSCTDCPEVTISPDMTTTYTVLATTNDGCVLMDTFVVNVLPIPEKTLNISFCPGDSVVIDGVTYTQSTTFTSIIPATTGCDTIATYILELGTQPTFTQTISFCPGDSVVIDGVTYTQSTTVTSIIPATTGCDTIATYVLVSVTPAPSVVSIECPDDINITIDPGAGPTVATYDLPDATSDCPCPGLSLELTAGLPSGSAFPPGETQVCYTAQVSCGNTASCCFNVMIQEVEPCDVKNIGCMKYELLSITKDAGGNKTYSIRVTNFCANPMTYTAIQLPNGVVADEPANNSIYTASSGRQYSVRNPNYSPFYSVRFKSTADSIRNGQSDIFDYTLPPQAQPAYIHITARLEPQVYYEAHLNTFYCPIGMAPVTQDRSQEGVEQPKDLLLFPNPTSGSLFADLSAWEGEQLQIQVFDSRGQRVQHLEVTADGMPQRLPLHEGLSNGLYFFDIRMPDGMQRTTRILLQR